jgi:hypothetical protein
VTDDLLEERRSHPTMHDRLGLIEADIGRLSSAMAEFCSEQKSVNREFRDHMIHSSDLGEVHEDKYSKVIAAQASYEARLRSVEDWRVELRTYGTILKLTFGVSIIGAIVSLLTLADVAGRVLR